MQEGKVVVQGGFTNSWGKKRSERKGRKGDKIRKASQYFGLFWLKWSLFSLVHSRSSSYQSFGLDSIIWITQPLYMWHLLSWHFYPEGGWTMWCSDNGVPGSSGSCELWANVPCPSGYAPLAGICDRMWWQVWPNVLLLLLCRVPCGFLRSMTLPCPPHSVCPWLYCDITPPSRLIIDILRDPL